MLKKLFVTKIFEGGVNLLTGEHISHGLVISNGEAEVFIPVSTEDVDHLAALVCEDGEKTPAESNTKDQPNVRVIKEDPKPAPAAQASKLSLVPPGPGSSYDDELTGVSSL